MLLMLVKIEGHLFLTIKVAVTAIRILARVLKHDVETKMSIAKVELATLYSFIMEGSTCFICAAVVMCQITCICAHDTRKAAI